MDSPFANIFLAVQQRIRTELPAARYIDQDLGQLKAGGKPPVSWPCVLIDLEDFDFTDLGENVQASKGTVVFRLGFTPYSGSSQLAPAAGIQQAIAYYDLEWALHKALQGWSPGNDFGSFNRMNVVTQKRTDGYRVRELRYSIAFEDYSAKRRLQYTPATITINDEMAI